MPDPLDEIRRLQALRGRPERETSISPLVAGKAAEARRAERGLGSFVDLWEGVMPQELALRTRVTGLRGGVVQVTVDSSSTAWELDRLLREGLQEQLRRAYGRTLLRVRITVGEVG